MQKQDTFNEDCLQNLLGNCSVENVFKIRTTKPNAGNKYYITIEIIVHIINIITAREILKVIILIQTIYFINLVINLAKHVMKAEIICIINV